jgi:hypothetical protein
MTVTIQSKSTNGIRKVYIPLGEALSKHIDLNENEVIEVRR